MDCKSPARERGIFFSIDAVFALAISAMLITLAFGIISETEHSSESDLSAFRQSSDFLALLENTGALSRMSASEMSNFSSLLPPNVCLESLKITAYPAGTQAFSTGQLSGCSCASARRTVSAKRSFVIVNSSSATASSYVAELSSCRRAG